MIAPAARSFLTTPASSGTIDPSKLKEPAVVFMPIEKISVTANDDYVDTTFGSQSGNIVLRQTVR